MGEGLMFNRAKVEIPELEIVDWSTGTDRQIARMVQADRNGKINLQDYWSVGDTRTVILGAISASGTGWSVGESQVAQEIDLVLMDTTCQGFTWTQTPASGQTKPRFIVGQKDDLSTAGYMNSSDTTTNGWSGCARRGWCNNGYYNAIPSTLRSIFKQFHWQQGIGGGAYFGLLATDDYFALAPAQAVFGSTKHYAQTDEDALYSQWTWYQTSSNRIKKLGKTGSPKDWWECSPDAGVSTAFCSVSSFSGGAGGTNAGGTIGLAPFGCI